MRVRRTFLALVSTIALLGLAGCSGSSDDADGADAAETGTAGEDHAGHVMNEPDATPADQLDGDRTQGTFQVLDTAPPNSEGVAGRAYVTQQEGTTVTVRLTGLEADAEYLAHLHAEPCSVDDGGPHFAFDPDGEEMPPNEIHLSFTADADGAGEATVTNDRRVEDRAPSVVVHPAEAPDNRLACADLAK